MRKARVASQVQARQRAAARGLEIIRLLWSGGYRSYQGRHLTLEDAGVVDAYRKAGGDGPRYREVPLAFAPDEEAAASSATS